MKVEEFILATSGDQPPAGLRAELQALWQLRKGNWERAHAVVQEHDDDLSCAWVHAHIHRIEGDMDNARYWYRRAGRQVETRGLEEEWKALVAHFLVKP
jgi:hypothetical protein